MAKKKESKIRVTLVRSPIGRPPRQRATLKALGLGKVNSSVEKVTSDAVLGMVNTVAHLVKVEEL